MAGLDAMAPQQLLDFTRLLRRQPYQHTGPLRRSLAGVFWMLEEEESP